MKGPPLCALHEGPENSTRVVMIGIMAKKRIDNQTNRTVAPLVYCFYSNSLKSLRCSDALWNNASVKG